MPDRNHHVYDVLIVGGGVSGLSALEQLTSAGVSNVLLLEAGEDVGGRICTIFDEARLGGGHLELGAQWIHGRGENPLWKFANEHQIPVGEDDGGDGDGPFLLPGGDRVPRGLLGRTINFLEGLHSRLDSYFRDPGMFDEWILKEGNPQKRKLMEAVYSWFIKFEQVDTGVENLDDQSVLSWGEYVDYDNESGDGSDPVFSEGYVSLVRRLRTIVGDRGVIKTGSEVAKISWADHRNAAPVVVACSSQAEYRAKHVLGKA